MKYKLNFKIIIILLLLIISVLEVNGLTTNGTDKSFDFAITSSSNNKQSSTNFVSYVVLGDTIAAVNSSNYNVELGFIRTVGYLSGETCSKNIECIGGFCCSNSCQSTSCPVAEEEAAAAAGGAEASGGGGGAAGFIPDQDYIIYPDLIKTVIKQGSVFQTEFVIENIGKNPLDIVIDPSFLSDILLLSETEFTLDSKDSKTIGVTIFAGEDKKPDVYSGNIIILGNNIKKTLPVIIEVRAKEALFDIKVDVLPFYKYILKTESVIANITLTNVGDLKPIDVELFYSIRSIGGEDLQLGIETFAVYDQVTRLKELELPKNISLGKYLFYGKVSWGIESAISADIFEVVETKPVSCFDGIQNQDEQGIDCGGSCGKCKRKISIPLFTFLGTIIIIFAIIKYIIFRKPSKIRGIILQRKIKYLYNYIDQALSKGYRLEHFVESLIIKGYPRHIIKKMHDLVVSDKLKAFEILQTKQKPKQLPHKIYPQLTSYINTALNIGYSTGKISKELFKVGWPKNIIQEHIDMITKKRLKK